MRGFRILMAAAVSCAMLLSACSSPIFSEEEKTQIHDITSAVEKQQIAYHNVIEGSIPDRLGELIAQDGDFARYLSTRTLDADKPTLALTFNAGPDTEVTARILDILEENGVHATFFVDPEKLDEDTAALVKRMGRIGCEVAYYMSEPGEMAYLDESEIRKTLREDIQKIEQYSGRDCLLARPYGGYVQEVVSSKMSQSLIYWTIDTQDAVYEDAATTRTMVETYAEDGAIVLMHDLYDTTASAVRNMIPDLLKDDYQLVTVSELAYLKGVTLQAGESYYSITAQEASSQEDDEASDLDNEEEEAGGEDGI